MAKLIEPNGRITKITPSGSRFSVEELQAAIGGGDFELLAIIVNHQVQWLVIDADGHQKNLPVNRAASNLYNSHPSSIRGTVLLWAKNEIV